MSQEKNSEQRPPANAPRKTPKSRKHGYRGYGSGMDRSAAGGRVHWGRGFTGVEFPDAGGETLPEAGLFSKDLKEKVSDEVKESAPKKP